MAKSEPIIEIKDVSVTFNKNLVLNHFSMAVNRGDFVLLHGNTGCGKSTILHLIAGLVLPSEGEIYVAGECVNAFNEQQRRWLRRSMGLMVQSGLLLDDRSILDNVMLPALAAAQSMGEARRRAKAALETCSIAELANFSPTSLSAGQRQLACLARAVVNRPVVILADEPTAHLDKSNAQTLLNLFENFARSGVTVIVASHLKLIPNDLPSRKIALPDATGGHVQ